MREKRSLECDFILLIFLSEIGARKIHKLGAVEWETAAWQFRSFSAEIGCFTEENVTEEDESRKISFCFPLFRPTSSSSSSSIPPPNVYVRRAIVENEKDESKEVTFENVFSIPLSRMNNTDLEEVWREKRTDRNYILFNIFGKRKKEMQMKGQRVSAKMFGKEIAEDSSRRERREKKSCFPSVFERGSRKLVYTGAFVCGGTITFPPTFFRFSSSLWILAGKGNFSAGTSTREAAFRATSYPVGAINEREGRRREEDEGGGG